jgi:choline dehydrogenase
VNGVRVNAALAFLTEAVRARPHLQIRGEAVVDRLVLGERRVKGVRLVDGTTIEADTVVLTAGAYGTAGVLMRTRDRPGHGA